MFMRTTVCNKDTKEVCLKHESIGIHKRLHLDLRFFEVENNKLYAYYIENIDLPFCYWRYHRVAVMDDKIRFESYRLNFSDFK